MPYFSVRGNYILMPKCQKLFSQVVIGVRDWMQNYIHNFLCIWMVLNPKFDIGLIIFS